MLTLTALVRNVFPTNEFKDKVSGEITPPGHKVQLEYESLVGQVGDKKLVLDDFNVRQQGDMWRKATGKYVSVPVGVYLKEGGKDYGLYLPKGALPTLVATPPAKTPV